MIAENEKHLLKSRDTSKRRRVATNIGAKKLSNRMDMVTQDLHSNGYSQMQLKQ